MCLLYGKIFAHCVGGLVSFMMHRRVGNLTQCANSLPRNEHIYTYAYDEGMDGPMGKRNYLIEGVSGTGKGSVCQELRRRGYAAVDGDNELAYQGDPQGEGIISHNGELYGSFTEMRGSGIIEQQICPLMEVPLCHSISNSTAASSRCL